MNVTRLLVTGLLLGLGACSSQPQDYTGNQPEMDIRQFFNGDVDASGIFIGRNGRADPYMHVAMHGQWQGNDGTLTEHFVYSDGRTDDRVWSLHMTDDHHFTGTAHDVVGTAQGQQFGNASNMLYVLSIPNKEKTSSHDISMDDWIYRLDQNNAINRVQMSKLGFGVGELVISFHKK